MKEIDNLHQRLLRLILTCHILEGNSCLLLHIDLGVVLPDSHRSACSAHLAEHQAEQQPHQQNRQYDRNNDLPESGIVTWNAVSLDAMRLKPPCQRVQILHQYRIIGLLGRLHSVQSKARKQSRILSVVIAVLRGFLCLQAEINLARGANLHILDLVLLNVLKELGIRDLLSVSPSAEDKVYEKENQKDNGQSCQKHCYNIRPLRRFISIVPTVSVISSVSTGHISAVSVIIAPTVVISAESIVHSSSISVFSIK